MLIIKSKFEAKVNQYEIKGNIAYIKLSKKDGSTIDTKINAEDLNAVLDKGTWFAEWDKDFNNYLVKTLNKSLKEKQTLHSFLLNTNNKTPIRHLNGDTLDNRRNNIKIYDQNAVVNDYEVVDTDSVYIILRDKYGNKNGRVLIDSQDLDKVINSFHSWVYYIQSGEHYAVANTKDGRIYLHNFLMAAPENMVTKFVTHNTLDCRKCNLKNELVVRQEPEKQL